MKTRGQHPLDRYSRNEEGILCIDVATEKVEDLYSHFDRFSPHLRRDLDQDLVDYLSDCAEEIHPKPFVIRFTFFHTVDADRIQRIQHSINSYFDYLIEKERQTLRAMNFRSGMFLLLGILILAASVMLEQFATSNTVMSNVFAQGVNVAAWVSLWEALATFLVDWFPHQRQIRLFRSLANAKLHFLTYASTPVEIIPAPSGQS